MYRALFFQLILHMEQRLDRPTLKKCVHIGDILTDLLRSHQRKHGRELTLIISAWDDAVGDQIAGYARPSAYKNHRLTVDVANSIWLQQLQFLKDELMVRLNEKLGDKLIADIKFKIGAARA